jgi:hypothetical protein
MRANRSSHEGRPNCRDKASAQLPAQTGDVVLVVCVLVVCVLVVCVLVVCVLVVCVLVVEVEVVPLTGVLTGDAAAWAGTMTDSTTGLIHLEGRRMVTVRPPTTRRRVALNSLMKCPRLA